MNSAAAAQIMRQADAVKSTMTDSGKAFSELWVTRQKLEDLYKKMLLLDLEYALDKKVEQELWNHAFKNQITTLQTQAKDRQNPKKAEAQASLNLFLETASGFYLQFLQIICCTFRLDLPFRRRSAAFGIMRENTINYKNITAPKKSSCLYICCHCLVHLGDIARYRQQTEQAQTYYRHAANLSPNNGQPYNQLAILEASRGDKLSTVFYYVRSLAVRHPFPVAATNLEKFYSKLIKDTRSEFEGPNLTMSEIISAFLQFQALLHMSTGLDRASNLKTKIISGLGSHIRSQTVSAAHLTGIVAISVFALHRAQSDTNEGGDSSRKVTLSQEEKWCVQIHTSFLAKLLETMLQLTPKEDNKARDSLTLPAIKVMLDWLYLNKDIVQKKEYSNTSIWSDLCKLLNTLQWLLNDINKASDVSTYEEIPLPEDMDLRCFQPLEPTYSSYNFSKALSEELSAACERDLRCQRLVAHGKWLAQDLSRLKLITYQPSKSIRNQFSTQKAPQNSDSNQPTINQPMQKPAQRQNVAMQTILKKQMQKKMEQDKGSTSPLSVISEEGKSPTAELSQPSTVLESAISPSIPAAATQKSSSSSRPAGVINVHHKPTLKNLPPRLSAKVSANQNAALSPRLQKQQAARNSNTPSSQIIKNDLSSDNFKEDGSDTYPTFNMEDYPALVSQRSSTSLIPQSTANQPGNVGFLNNPNWGVLNLGRDGGNGAANMMSSGVGLVSSPMDNSSNPRSPQASPRIVSPFSNTEPSLRLAGDHSGINAELEQAITACGVNFPSSNLSADFLSAIRSANQIIQQQQANFHPLQQQQQQQLPSYQQQHPQYNQVNRMMQQPVLRTNQTFYPSSVYGQAGDGTNLPGSGMAAQSANSAMRSSSQLPNSMLSQMMKSPAPGSMPGVNMPPPPSQRALPQSPLDNRSMAGPSSSGVGYQACRSAGGAQSFVTTPAAPVGFIPPSGLVPPQGQAAGVMSSSNFPAQVMSGGPGRCNAGPSVQSASSYLGQQQQPAHHTQKQSSGLLYQNIPLPGSAGSGSGSTSTGFTSLYMPGQGQPHHGQLPVTQMMGPQPTYSRSGPSSQTSQDSRLSSSFQGHAAGTPKPEKSGNGSGPYLLQQQQPHPSTKQLTQAQQSMIRAVMEPPQQSMIRAVMDPPFLPASGEYTLFSSNSSPAWPTSVVKTSTGQLLKAAPMKGSGSMVQAGGNTGEMGVVSMQGMWSNTGPSPLERLLEQQRNQRQADG